MKFVKKFVRHSETYLRVNPCNLQHGKETKEVSQSKVIDNANNTEKKENCDSEHDFEDLDTMFDLGNQRLGNKQERITEEKEENDVSELTHMIN